MDLDARNTDLHSAFEEGFRLHKAGKSKEAALYYRFVLERDDHHFNALQLLGLIQLRSGALAESLRLFEQALTIQPMHGETLNNYGNALSEAGRLQEAIDAYQRAIATMRRPQAITYRNLGSALVSCGRRSEGREAMLKSLSLDSHDPVTHAWLGHLALVAADYPTSIELFDRALALKHSTQVQLVRLLATQKIAQWTGWHEQCAQICAATPPPNVEIDPFRTNFVTDNATVHRRYANVCAAYLQSRVKPILTSRLHSTSKKPTSKIRISYLSADIRVHPVAQLLAGVLEHHDRSRFEVAIYATGPTTEAAERTRIAAACDRFEAIEQATDPELATMIASGQTDILIDLMGYSAKSCPRVLAARPAPILVSWLGYPGTLGGTLLDYLIADDYVIPERSTEHYAEKIVRLPDCYLPNDQSRKVAAATSRASYGLPEGSIVLCSFCQIDKITPTVFSVWMDVLRARQRCILWLFNATPIAMRNLRNHAEQQGVSGERLVFAARVESHADHLARYTVADLALDTFPYGSHTTAADALWVGCPLVGLSGEGFASRVSGSLLRAAGVPELITSTPEAYRDLLLELSANDERRAKLRHHLTSTRESSALFDVKRFTLAFEESLMHIHARYLTGLPPSDTSIGWIKDEPRVLP
jgi:predicted O-linked N-acetylglucosamine transferase (SPINDLY family)